MGVITLKNDVFRFPKDTALKKRWTDQVKRTRSNWTWPSKNSVVCSEHFTKDCFDNANDLYKSFGIKKRLKEGAVPTVFIRKKTVSEQDHIAKRRRALVYYFLI